MTSATLEDFQAHINKMKEVEKSEKPKNPMYRIASGQTQDKYRHMIGKRQGRLVMIDVTNKCKTVNGDLIILCQCDCGNEHKLGRVAFNKGSTNSCGCIKRGPRSERSEFSRIQ